MTDKSLNPLAPLREFDVNGFHVLIRQRVTGALEWLATDHKPTVRDWSVVGAEQLPVGFTVDDVEEHAREFLGRLAPRPAVAAEAPKP